MQRSVIIWALFLRLFLWGGAHESLGQPADRLAEAEAVYRADLGPFPESGRSFYGLAENPRAPGKTEQATEMQEHFGETWCHASVTLTSSRFLPEQ